MAICLNVLTTVTKAVTMIFTVSNPEFAYLYPLIFHKNLVINNDAFKKPKRKLRSRDTLSHENSMSVLTTFLLLLNINLSSRIKRRIAKKSNCIESRTSQYRLKCHALALLQLD